LFTGFWLILWLFNGWPMALPALLALIAALVLDFAPLPDLRPYRRDLTR
jgi:hypothetical protein